MSDRLKDLQRQRALVQEQLAWLDREIARETGAAPQPTVTPAVILKRESAAPYDADKLIEKYGAAQPVQNEVRKGCFLYFFAALALLILGIALLYFFRTRR